MRNSPSYVEIYMEIIHGNKHGDKDTHLPLTRHSTTKVVVQLSDDVAVQALLDTGAGRSCVQAEWWAQDRQRHDDEPEKTHPEREEIPLVGADRRPLDTLGVEDIKFKMGNRVLTQEVAVVRELKQQLILGCGFLRRTNVVIDSQTDSVVLRRPQHSRSGNRF
jgi:hypothetical protein